MWLFATITRPRLFPLTGGGMKSLLVNGMGMTTLTPITKFIADLPLAFHEGKPKSILVICFGMGTTYRSALSWGIDTTVVELVPSVTKAFGFYHADAEKCENDPNGRIIIDDGRRYLSRCARKFDVIVVDPPPPWKLPVPACFFPGIFMNWPSSTLTPTASCRCGFPAARSSPHRRSHAPSLNRFRMSVVFHQSKAGEYIFSVPCRRCLYSMPNNSSPECRSRHKTTCWNGLTPTIRPPILAA